jgi:hypothetical protein
MRFESPICGIDRAVPVRVELAAPRGVSAPTPLRWHSLHRVRPSSATISATRSPHASHMTTLSTLVPMALLIASTQAGIKTVLHFLVW